MRVNRIMDLLYFQLLVHRSADGEEADQGGGMAGLPLVGDGDQRDVGQWMRLSAWAPICDWQFLFRETRER